MTSTQRAATSVMPTKREVIAEIKVGIESWRSGNAEPDGVVRDTAVLHSIRCLEVALLIVRAAKFPIGANR